MTQAGGWSEGKRGLSMRGKVRFLDSVLACDVRICKGIPVADVEGCTD